MDDVQAIVLSSIFSVTGTLSALGSSAIIYMILSDGERKLGRPYHRLMLMMSCFDVIQSLALAISPLPLPHDSGVYGAKGNSSTCTAQGFFVTLGYSVALYNAGLNIFFMLTIRYNFSSEQFTKYEPAVHATAIIIPLFWAIFFTANGSMSRRGVVCASRSRISAVIIGVAFILICFICISTMISICKKVDVQTSRIKRYIYVRRNSPNRSTPAVEQRNETIKQAFLYLLAFALTHAASSMISLTIRGRAEIQPPFALLLSSAIFYPLQGFWSFCFYVRPAVKFVMQTNPNMSIFRAVYSVIFNRTIDIGNRRGRRRSSMIHRIARERNDSTDRTQSRDITSISPATLCCTATGISMEDTTPCEPDGESDNKIKQDSKNNTKLSRQAYVEDDSVLNEEGILEDSPFNDATPFELDVESEDQVKSASENEKKDVRLSLVDVVSVMNYEDIVEVEPVDTDKDLENQNKLGDKRFPKRRRVSLVEIGSVLNDDDLEDLNSLYNL